MSETIIVGVGEFVGRYDALLAKAAKIVYVSEIAYARLVVDGDEAFVVSPDARHDYDSCVLEADNSRRFPTRLLIADDATIDAWKAECKRQDEIAHKEWQRQQQAKREAQERVMLATLKQKYEPAP